MCNLSKGVEEKGIAQGREEEREEMKKLVLKLLKSDDINIAAACKMLNLSEKEVYKALEKLELE